MDALGNLTLTVKGTDPAAPRVMIFAHTDQMGLVVRRIEADGYLRIERLGGVPDRVLPGLRMVVTNRHGETIPCIVGIKAHHATPQDEKSQVVGTDKLYLDLGVDSAAEVAELGIEIGAPVTYSPEFQRFGPHKICGTALDDRAGCAALMELIRSAVEIPVPATLLAVFTVQEEFNLRGAMVSAQRLLPDAAISIDIMVASDTPDLLQRGDLRLGGGPALGMYSFHGRGTLNGTLPHPALVNHLSATGAETGIPLQRSAHTGCLTDSSYVQLVGDGIPSMDIGFPTRYTHTPIEVCDLRDLEGIVVILHGALDNMTSEFSFSRRRA
ncbi:M42 family metallopeptidase [Rhizobium leguminosarum]|uniref:M42 family metallopeptidase n=1 Tax=Rhizobium leguminosarum TaxID=384 RepID=UPI001E01020D|nr:M20/M25/M40 family metallo-hydrolase [Rhizobium leguminosarum]MBP2448448.1 putative aminopeptidase FrvX [Rhizobium leguminosarum]